MSNENGSVDDFGTEISNPSDVFEIIIKDYKFEVDGILVPTYAFGDYLPDIPLPRKIDYSDILLQAMKDLMNSPFFRNGLNRKEMNNNFDSNTKGWKFYD